MRFEWNEAKNLSNQKKHGIGFEAASRVFADPNLLLRKDRVVEGEQRWGSSRKLCCWWSTFMLRRIQMAKKTSVSSRPAKLTRMSAESIWSKPLNSSQKAALSRIAKRQKRSDASQIDYSDIPRLTVKELAQFKRPPKKLVAIRLDADVFAWLRKFGAGYSTRINEVLRAVMTQQRKSPPFPGSDTKH